MSQDKDMSEADEALSIGKTVLEYVASKRRLGALEADIARIAQQFEETVAALRQRPPQPGAANQFLGLASGDSLRALTSEVEAETRRHAELLKRIRSMGLEG